MRTSLSPRQFQSDRSIAHTYDGGGLGDNGWNEGTFTKTQNPLTRLLQVQSCLCPTGKYQPRGRQSRFAGRGTVTCTEGYMAKSRVLACRPLGHATSTATPLSMRVCSCQACVTTTVLQCSDSTIRPERKARRARSHKLDGRRDLRRGMHCGPRARLGQQF